MKPSRLLASARLFSVILVALCCVIILSSPLPARAEEGCGLTGPVHELVSALKPVSFSDGAVTPAQVTQIAEIARRISQKAVGERLEFLGLAHKKTAVDQLLEEARKISSQGFVTRSWYLQVKLQDVKRLILFACRIDPRSVEEARVEWEVSKLLRNTLGPQYAPPPGSVFEMLLRIILPVLLLAILLVAAFAARLACRKIGALTVGEHICRIPCTVDLGDESVDGLVIVLRRSGCEFRPDDPADAPRLIRKGWKRQLVLSFAGRKVAASLQHLSDGVVFLGFSRSFGLGEFRDLLAEIAPLDSIILRPETGSALGEMKG